MYGIKAFLRWGVLEQGLSCSSSCGCHSICTTWGHEANQLRHIQNTLNLKHNHNVAWFHPGFFFFQNTLNLPVLIKKKKIYIYSCPPSWHREHQPLFTMQGYGSMSWGKKSLLDMFSSWCVVVWAITAHRLWPLLESACCDWGVLVVEQWAELMGYFPGESCWA